MVRGVVLFEEIMKRGILEEIIWKIVFLRR
jgi:hypothetical protein